MGQDIHIRWFACKTGHSVFVHQMESTQNAQSIQTPICFPLSMVNISSVSWRAVCCRNHFCIYLTRIVQIGPQDRWSAGRNCPVHSLETNNNNLKVSPKQITYWSGKIAKKHYSTLHGWNQTTLLLPLCNEFIFSDGIAMVMVMAICPQAKDF